VMNNINERHYISIRILLTKYLFFIFEF